MANNKYKNSRRNNKTGSYNRNRDDKRSNSKEAPEVGASNPEESTSKPGNDISWYTRNPELIAAAGSFPYPNRPGMTLQLGTITEAKDDAVITYPLGSDIPGIMVLDWAPSIGLSSKATDPASILGKEMYARVRKAYSGTLRADAPDYVIYVLALDSLYSYIAWLKRLYRTLNVWSPNNYVLPDGILHGMGLTDPDIQSLRAGRVELWQLINQLVLQSRKFTCPGSLDVINRHYWMNDNIYTDAPTINSQFYMFNQEIYLQYEMAAYDESNETVGGLTGYKMPWYRSTTVSASTALKPVDLYNVGINMLNALIGWDDSYTINGYLQRAYEGEAMFVVDELPLDAQLEPIYSPEVLVQIENSTCIPYGYLEKLSTGFNIWQNPSTNAIVSKPSIITQITNDVFAEKDVATSLNCFINQRVDNPGALDNVIATRLKAIPISITKDGPTTTILVECATEVPLCWRMVGASNSTNTQDNVYSGTNATDGLVESEAIPSYIFATSMSSGLQSAIYNKLFELDQFDWHPITLLVFKVLWKDDGSVKKVHVVGDVHNPTVVTKDELTNLHRVCLYSEFNSFGMS